MTKKKPWTAPKVKQLPKNGTPFQIIDSFDMGGGHKVIDLSHELKDDQSITQVTKDTIAEIESNAKTPGDRVQAYMMKISELVYQFVGDKCRDKKVSEHYSVKIAGNGFTMIVMMCNGLTRTIAGKTWAYEDFINMAATEGKIELVMNDVIEKIIKVCDTEAPLEDNRARFI